MNPEPSARGLEWRIKERVLAWSVDVERMVETESSVLAFGRREYQAVVVKIIKTSGNEWLSGQVLEAFDGKAVVRALDHVAGAVLLERLTPGLSMSDIEDISDEETTEILTDVMKRMAPASPPGIAATVEAWSDGFGRYAARGTGEIPMVLVEAARRIYAELCDSQSATRLLHGDLHHRNVLLDEQRGWLAIDPKGVIGEVAYEIGAALRNPCERPALFAERATIEKRVERFAGGLRLDPQRILGWAFSQAVLAAIWEIEDGGVLNVGRGWIALANAIRPMLRHRVDA